MTEPKSKSVDALAPDSEKCLKSDEMACGNEEVKELFPNLNILFARLFLFSAKMTKFRKKVIKSQILNIRPNVSTFRFRSVIYVLKYSYGEGVGQIRGEHFWNLPCQIDLVLVSGDFIAHDIWEYSISRTADQVKNISDTIKYDIKM